MDSQPNSPFAPVATGAKPALDKLDPRATRYGVLPIWEHPTDSRSFALWILPADRVFPFRPFIGEVVKDLNDNVLSVNERMPADQIMDMFTVSPYFIELPELSKFTEQVAGEIVTALTNPEPCIKYQYELGNRCGLCTLKYLRETAPAAISAVFAERPVERRAANDIAQRLIAGYDKAVIEAGRRTDVAIREIDDPKSGKSEFTPEDFVNVYNIHGDRPVYKTSVSNQNAGADAIAKAIDGLQKPGVDPEQLGAIIDAAIEKATAPLKERLAAYENPTPILEPIITTATTNEEAETFGQKMARLKAEKKAASGE